MTKKVHTVRVKCIVIFNIVYYQLDYLLYLRFIVSMVAITIPGNDLWHRQRSGLELLAIFVI